MTSSPSKSGYKWWESDDKTKRLYTELLAEKIARSPKKTPKTNTTLTRSLSSCSDLRSRIQALEHQGNSPPSSPIKRSASIRSLSSLESDSSQREPGKKYTFETVTMDTLAKYEYIKSPKKKPFGSNESPSSSSLSSSPSPPTSGSDEEYEKKSFSMQKTYDVKERASREASSFHGNEKSGFQGDQKKNWAWSSKETTGGNTDRWSLSSKDKGKGPATPTKSCFSPKTSPRISSLDSDTWMNPNPMFMLMTSSQKPELKSFGLTEATAKTSAQDGVDVAKDKFSKRKSKLDEVPEYKSSSSDEDVADGASSDGMSGRERAKNLGKTFKVQEFSSPKFSFRRANLSDKKGERNENNDKNDKGKMKLDGKKEGQARDESKKAQENGKVKLNHVDEVEEQIDINQIAKRFQALCEEVEQLEFKMFEFSDDIHKLKIGIGLKDDGKESENLNALAKHSYKHAFTLAAGKDLLSERATARALLLKQYSSPSKSPRSISKLLQDTGVDKEMAEADAKRSQALEEELRKINEKDLTEDEIQEVLRSAKSKYIDRPNYLEDIGFNFKRHRKKG